MRIIIKLLIDGCLLLCSIVQAFILACLLVCGYVPLPAGWVSQKITQQLPPGLSLRAERYALQVDGTLRVEQPELYLDGFEQALFRAVEIEAQLGIRRDRQSPLVLQAAMIRQGMVALPAVYAPDGGDQPLLERIALRFVPTANGLIMDSCSARHGNIHLRGSIHWISSLPSARPIPLRQRADRFFQQAAQLLQHQHQLAGLTEPTVFFRMHPAADGAVHLETRISSRGYQNPRFQLSELMLDASFALTEQQVTHTAPLRLQAAALQIPTLQTRATSLRARLEPEQWRTLLEGKWPNVQLLAGQMESHGIALETPCIRLNACAFPEITFSGMAGGLQGAADFSGSFNLQTQAANIQAAGNLDLLDLLPDQWSARLPAIRMARSPDYQLSMHFGPGFAWRQGELQGQVDGLQLDALHFDQFRFQGSYEAGLYRIQQAYLRRGWQWLELGMRMDAASHDYALTLKGTARPDDYNLLLPRWWAELFEDFDFSAMTDGLGDFVIYGNTQDQATGCFFGHASARMIAYKGVPVDAAELFVRGQGPYVEVHQLDARSGAGYVRGDIGFASRLDEGSGPLSVRFDLESQLPLAETAKLVDAELAGILTDFDTEQLPRARLQGAVFNPDYAEFAEMSQLDLHVDCPGPLHYNGLPLEHLRFVLQSRAGSYYLRDMQIGYAGGSVQAEADILTSGAGSAQTRFQLALKNADPALAMDGLNALRAGAYTRQTPDDSAGHAQLDLTLHAAGPVDNALQLQGNGSFQLKHDALYAIQLFGPLSRLLQNTRLGFTSFALDSMAGEFALNEATVDFNRIEISGPRSRIEALGTLGLEDQSLAMRVSVFLFGNAGRPESGIRKISDLITRPLPNLLEFELSGSLQNQSWRSLYDPRQFIPLR